jgi:hypothetical protein
MGKNNVALFDCNQLLCDIEIIIRTEVRGCIIPRCDESVISQTEFGESVLIMDKRAVELSFREKDFS